jgi:hypothetical protein
VLHDNDGKFGQFGRPLRVENAGKKLSCRSVFDKWLWQEMGGCKVCQNGGPLWPPSDYVPASTSGVKVKPSARLRAALTPLPAGNPTVNPYYS